MTGFSFGAAMAYRVACELSSRITAVAPVSGALVFDNSHPTRSISVFVMHGTEDGIFPIVGGGDYHVPAASQAVQTWALRDACVGAPVQTKAGITVSTVWDRCNSGSLVRLDVVTGGPHAWFGLEPGALPAEPSASAAVCDFFSRLSAAA